MGLNGDTARPRFADSQFCGTAECIDTARIGAPFEALERLFCCTHALPLLSYDWQQSRLVALDIH